MSSTSKTNGGHVGRHLRFLLDIIWKKCYGVHNETSVSMSDLRDELFDSYKTETRSSDDYQMRSQLETTKDLEHNQEITTQTDDELHSSIGFESEITKVPIRSTSPVKSLENTVIGSRMQDKSHLSIDLDSEITEDPIRNTASIRVFENSEEMGTDILQCSSKNSHSSHIPDEDVQLKYSQGETTPTLGNAMMSSVQQSNLEGTLKSLTEDYDKKVSAVIHLLLLEKYKNTLICFEEKRIKRNKCTTIFQNFEHEKCQKLVMECIGVENRNVKFQTDADLGIRQDSSEPKSHLKEMDFTLSKNENSRQDSGNFTLVESFGAHSRSEYEQETTIKHDEHQVIPIAREKEISLCRTPDFPIEFINYYSTPAECTFGSSIGSSRTSSLISAINNSGSLCHYSPVIKIEKQRNQISVSQPSFNYELSENDYESVTNLRMNKIEFTNYYSTPAECTFGSSIGSSRTSSLISAINNSGYLHSHYSPVIEIEKQINKISVSQPSFNNEFSENHYESVTNLRMNKVEEMFTQYAIQYEIIRQARKALTVAKKTPQSFDWEILAEAEKILYVARYKRDIIAHLLTQTITDESVENCATATVRISNIKFFSSDSHINSKNRKRNKKYFLCILHCESTILGSKLVELRGNEVLFKDSFQFEHIPPESEITLNLFSMKKMTKKVKNKMNFFWRKNDISTISQSSLVSWGQTKLKLTDVPQESSTALSLSNIPVEANISSSYTAEILVLQPSDI